MDNPPNSVDIFLVCPVDDRIGVRVDLVGYIDKPVNRGFRRRELERKRDIEGFEFASEAPGQRLDPVGRFVADTTERDKKAVDMGVESLGIEAGPFTKIVWVRIGIQRDDQVSVHSGACFPNEPCDCLRSPHDPIVELARFELSITAITPTECRARKPRGSESDVTRITNCFDPLDE